MKLKRNITKRSVLCLAVIIGVVVLPLLYSYFYLGAFWDPYSRLEKLPVAVVNNDEGALINGEQRNIGQEMCDKLKEQATLKFVFTDEKTAKDGTEGKEYYAMITIPENFSADIASASTTEKHTASITYAPNEKRNFLSSQILSRAVLEIEESTRSSINQEIVQNLADKLESVPSQMETLTNGLGLLLDGSIQLKNGTQALSDGTKEFKQKFTEYQKGVSDLKNGSATFDSGMSDLDTGIQQLLAGAQQLTESTSNIEALTTGSKQLASSALLFDSKLNEYLTGVDTLITSVNKTTDFLKYYVTSVNPSIMADPVFAAFISSMSDSSNAQNLQTLAAANTQLKSASGLIAQGAAKLQDGTSSLPELKSALAQLEEGLTQAKDGSAQLVTGADTLYGGMNTLTNATTQLATAAGEIANGISDLNNGASELNTGINTAQTEVSSSVTDTKDQLKSLDGLAEYAEQPVNVEQTSINPVPNYGTAFAPYFLSLSLWVGGLIIFVGIYLDADGKFKILSRDSKNKVARSFCYLLIGFVQAIMLATVIKWGLGLKVDNMALYYASCCLVSLVFIAIIQFLFVFLKDLGKFLAMVMLILQLTSCGGTFPMETVPKLFNVLYPFMPMTYSVGLFKQAISGVNAGEVRSNVLILSILLIVFMTATVLLGRLKGKVTAKKAEVIINEM